MHFGATMDLIRLEFHFENRGASCAQRLKNLLEVQDDNSFNRGLVLYEFVAYHFVSEDYLEACEYAKQLVESVDCGYSRLVSRLLLDGYLCTNIIVKSVQVGTCSDR